MAYQFIIFLVIVQSILFLGHWFLYKTVFFLQSHQPGRYFTFKNYFISLLYKPCFSFFLSFPLFQCFGSNSLRISCFMARIFKFLYFSITFFLDNLYRSSKIFFFSQPKSTSGHTFWLSNGSWHIRNC